MSHRLILRVAIGLTVFLGLVALAFAWSAGVRDARLNAAIASAGGAPSGNGESATLSSGSEIFEKRCRRCHSTDAVATWTSRQSENQCDALYEFLQKHRMAPQTENRVIALKFAPGCSEESKKPE